MTKSHRTNLFLLIGFLLPALFYSPIILAAKSIGPKIQTTPAISLEKTSEGKLNNPTLLEGTWLMPQLAIMMPTVLTLTNPNFEVAYGKQFPSLTQVSVATVTPLFNWGGFRVLSTAQLGFSYKAGLFEMTRFTGEILREKISLSWVPMSLGAKFLYSLSNFPFIKPSITLGGGSHWFYQAANIGGANESFWIPYYFVTTAVSFLEGTTPSDWFGGFTFGVTYQNSLTKFQSVKGLSFDLGLNLLL
ncbi:MAG: hypothetical protein EXR74_09290 [Bdellovibrionales bacterium]|nr:hypothetical protein [Bdellovibrionales bacterium]